MVMEFWLELVAWHQVMAVSPALEARRALVKLLLTLAAVYHVILDLRRDSCDNDVNKAFKKWIVKVHPDKGGSAEETKRLNAAKEAWEKAKRAPGRPAGQAGTTNSQGCQGEALEHPSKIS